MFLDRDDNSVCVVANCAVPCKLNLPENADTYKTENQTTNKKLKSKTKKKN